MRQTMKIAATLECSDLYIQHFYIQHFGTKPAFSGSEFTTIVHRVMKIELLKNSFCGVARHEEATLAALAIVPRKRRVLPVAGGHFDAVNETTLASDDDLMSLVAATFDPRRMTRAQAESLMELLEDAEFLSSDEVHKLSLALSLGTSADAALDLYEFVRGSLPASDAKSSIVSILGDIIARRYRAVS